MQGLNTNEMANKNTKILQKINGLWLRGREFAKN